jgi:hypothetical protein
VRRVAIGAAALLLAFATAAGAASKVTKHARSTVTIAAGRTRTVYVPYPDALKYGNATYAGKVLVLGAAPGAPGRRPQWALVKVLSAGSALGGSEYRARIRNANASGTAPVRVEVVATTVERLPHG